MVHALAQQLPTARSRAEPGRVLTLFADVAVALIGVGQGPGNAHANQTYPAALATTLGPEAAAHAATFPAVELTLESQIPSLTITSIRWSSSVVSIPCALRNSERLARRCRSMIL